MAQLQRTAEGLADYAKRCICIPHVYVWDANGEYITHALLDALSRKYPEWYTPQRLAARRALAGCGVRGWDCIGLIKSYVWGDYHQGNTQYYTEESDFCTRTLIQQQLVKGDIGTLPETPGLVLFKPGHVGVYIGGGKAIESTHTMPASAYMRCWEHTGDGSAPCCSAYDSAPDEPSRLGGLVETAVSECPWTHWLQYPGIDY